MVKKLNAKDFLRLVLLKGSYQTPEALTQEILIRYDRYYKCSTIERRLREMEDSGEVVNKMYCNKHNSSYHARWKLKTEVENKPTLLEQAKEITSIFMRIIKKGEGSF